MKMNHLLFRPTTAPARRRREREICAHLELA